MELSNRDFNMLKRAIQIASTSTSNQKHGALLYKGGRVISVGVNSHRNEHPSMEIGKTEYTIHAEIAAMRCIEPEILKNSTLYVARISRGGNVMNSAPCAMCDVIIQANGVKRVVTT